MTTKPVSIQAILAAVLYGAGKTRETKIQMDDAQKPMQVQMPVVNIDQEGDACVLVMKLEDVMPFVEEAYKIEVAMVNPEKPDGGVIVCVEKEAPAPRLLQANGEAFQHRSDLMARVLESFK